MECANMGSGHLIQLGTINWAGASWCKSAIISSFHKWRECTATIGLDHGYAAFLN